jgi:hypothetical protein
VSAVANRFEMFIPLAISDVDRDDRIFRHRDPDAPLSDGWRVRRAKVLSGEDHLRLYDAEVELSRIAQKHPGIRGGKPSAVTTEAERRFALSRDDNLLSRQPAHTLKKMTDCDRGISIEAAEGSGVGLAWHRCLAVSLTAFVATWATGGVSPKEGPIGLINVRLARGMHQTDRAETTNVEGPRQRMVPRRGNDHVAIANPPATLRTGRNAVGPTASAERRHAVRMLSSSAS